jgi:hypothetical protein
MIVAPLFGQLVVIGGPDPANFKRLNLEYSAEKGDLEGRPR